MRNYCRVMMMEIVQDSSAAMDEPEASSSSSALSASILKKFKEEFEKTGMFRFTPELEGKLTKCLNETFEENQYSGTAERVQTEELEQATLPPLVYQFEMPKQGCVFMGMLINGKPEVIINEEGSDSTPALSGFSDEMGLVYGTEALKLPAVKEKSSNFRSPKIWQCINLQQPFFTNQQHYQSIDLKELGLLNLPGVFFNAFLIRNLKITAESYCNGGFCGVAIMAVPMRTKSAQRLRLREAALLAGFSDVYLFSAEGLAAYYWFHQKEREMEQNNYSKEFVIIDLFGHAVVYKSAFEDDKDGKEVLVVKAIILLDLFNAAAKEKDKFSLMIRKTLKIPLIPQNNSVIPVVSDKGDLSSGLYLGSKYKANIAIVKDDEVKFFAVKGAALLSEQPENIELQVQNIIGSTVTIEPAQEVILPDVGLPVRQTFIIEHQKTKYQIYQIGCGRWRDKEMIGCLIINGVKYGAELEVTYECSWESILSVVGVSAKIPSEDDQEGCEEAVNWCWLIGDKMDFESFGGSSYEECKSLLLKVTKSSSQFEDQVETATLTEEVFNPPLDHPVGYSHSGASNGDQNEIYKRKRKVIRPDDLIRSTDVKKIKLEGDSVGGRVKTEEDWINNEEVEFEQGVKVKVEEYIIVD